VRGVVHFDTRRPRGDTIALMKCDRCENEATTHEIIVASGQRREVHLCEKCAAHSKLHAPASGDTVEPADDKTIDPDADTEITLGPGLGPMSTTDSDADATHIAADEASIIASARTSCQACKLTFAQFRHQGQMGCPACYSAFAELLAPLLARAHEGGTWHVGKKPARYRGAEAAPSPSAAPVVATTRRLSMLRASLAEAITNEQYELAARLRDELRALLASRAGGEGAPRTSPPTDPPPSSPGGGPA
jgi:protein arginine kinase activator